MANNDRCDGEGHHAQGQVRKYPLGGGSNAILCIKCVQRENEYRAEMRQQKGVQSGAYPSQPWPTLAIYDVAQSRGGEL